MQTLYNEQQMGRFKRTMKRHANADSPAPAR
jgi:hypothetical protein